MDELDRKLLLLLHHDARLPMAELGRRVGLSRTATLARVRRLESAGTIRGYHADIADAAAHAVHTVRVGIVVRTAAVADYVHRLATFRELQEAETLEGEFDLLARFCTRDAQRLDEILDGINAWPETVRTTTYVVVTRYLGQNLGQTGRR